MNGYLAFTKKEFMESVRTWRLLILGLVFLLLGIMNPFSAKIMPELLSSMMPDGMSVTISEPSAMDSWLQFFKNVPQIGLIVTVLLFSPLLPKEIGSGTLINMLTKGLSRSSVILAKFTGAAVTFSAVYLLCFGVSYAYTSYYWKETVSQLSLAVFALWFFGIFLIAALMLGGVLTGSSYGSLLFTGCIVVILFLASFFRPLQKFDPIRLAADNTQLLSEELSFPDFIPALVVCGILTLGLTLAAVALFERKKL